MKRFHLLALLSHLSENSHTIFLPISHWSNLVMTAPTKEAEKYSLLIGSTGMMNKLGFCYQRGWGKRILGDTQLFLPLYIEKVLPYLHA